ncbi:TetR family transcriptional regulator [Amycolatopsis sp. WQ 127309]|uniref:TetR family transcriptional regulator n=1 Tax=Amycolatopsis sp. WQ 127309 TaxID=2932773 RepID=UPI001FF46978|nr:TetR family transcriptional regulator [Amycolatopsis sp. WQ 127309]UOZ05542.1 TetR family transcriptional regulator [Amycolatopsis sp. WQ 127309]
MTAIEPGSFRTDWAGRSMSRATRTVDDYDELFTPIREARRKAGGNQLGNPAEAGDAVVRIAAADRPPAHLVLGSDALRLVAAARTAVDEEIRAWEPLSRTTAQGAGITRGALYFYFGSKQEVVTALVARTVGHLWERSRVAAECGEPREAIAAAVRRTVELWTEHGLVMRTAIDLSLTVPEIGELRNRTGPGTGAGPCALLAARGRGDL